MRIRSTYAVHLKSIFHLRLRTFPPQNPLLSSSPSLYLTLYVKSHSLGNLVISARLPGPSGPYAESSAGGQKGKRAGQGTGYPDSSPG